MAEKMVGKALSIKVRANGEAYEVYQKAPLDDGLWKLVTIGSFTKANDSKISFRWGLYCGSKKNQCVPNDALLFVTGVTNRAHSNKINADIAFRLEGGKWVSCLAQDFGHWRDNAGVLTDPIDRPGDSNTRETRP